MFVILIQKPLCLDFITPQLQQTKFIQQLAKKDLLLCLRPHITREFYSLQVLYDITKRIYISTLHRRHIRLLNSLFRLIKNEQMKALYYWTFVKGNHRPPVTSSHKGSVIWKACPYHGKIIQLSSFQYNGSQLIMAVNPATQYSQDFINCHGTDMKVVLLLRDEILKTTDLWILLLPVSFFDRERIFAPFTGYSSRGNRSNYLTLLMFFVYAFELMHYIFPWTNLDGYYPSRLRY